MRDVQLVPHLRAIHRKLDDRIAQLRADVVAGRRTASFVEGEEIPRLRETALAEADAASAALHEVRSALAEMAKWLPDPRDATATLRLAELVRQRSKAAPDAARLSRSSVAELTRLAEDSSDVVLVDDIRREFGFRAEAGQDLGALPLQVERRLGALCAQLPDVVARRAEHDRLAHIVERADDTLRAIRDGGEDAGVRADAYAEIRRQHDAGERSGPVDVAEVQALIAAAQ